MSLVKKFKAENGVSLVELIVSVGLFSIVMLSAAGIFKAVVDGQRSAISAQNVQENIRYALEKISKEIRMAQISNTDCLPAGVNKVFNTAAGLTELHFKNQYGDCVTYYLDSNSNRLNINVATGISAGTYYITPAKIEASNLKFFVEDDLIGSFHSTQPYVTMVMEVRAVGLAIHEQKMKIQMKVSPRYYE